MNAFKNDLQALVARHVAAASPERMLRLVDTLAAEEPALRSRESIFGVASPRFLNLDADGVPTEGDHVMVYQHETDLIWTAAPMCEGKELTYADAVTAAATFGLLGQKGWRLPTIRELLSIIDYERCDPAVDPAHFKGPYSWTWSSTIAKAPAGCAWSVALSGGNSGRFRRGDRNQALAVRAGQQLGLSV